MLYHVKVSPFYSKYFHDQFTEIVSVFKSEERYNYEAYFKDKKYIWITDPLHILKNGRSRILNNKVLINPEISGEYVHAANLNELLELGPALLDKSSIGKLRDIYPITIFKINNSLTALLNNNVDTFFYLFTYALWTEALLNPDITHKTKHELFKLLVDFAIINSNKLYQYLKTQHVNSSDIKVYIYKHKFSLIYFILMFDDFFKYRDRLLSFQHLYFFRSKSDSLHISIDNIIHINNVLSIS